MFTQPFPIVSTPNVDRALAFYRDLDAAINRMRGAGVTIVEEPVGQRWGERVARVLDPDGTEAVIGARPAAA